MDVKGYNIDRSKYLIDPFAENLLELVARYDEFKDDFKVQKLEAIRYIILMYDLKSTLKLDVRDFWERKRVAAICGGFKLNNKKEFDDEVEKMLLGENDAVNNAMTKYIMLFGIPTYAVLNIYYNRLTFEVQKALRGIPSKTALKDIDYLKKKIEECEEELYGGKEVVNAKKALYSRIEKERKYEKPEDIMLKISNGDDLSDFNPYGKDYKVEKQEFLGDE